MPSLLYFEYLIVIALVNFLFGAQGNRMAVCLVVKYNCMWWSLEFGYLLPEQMNFSKRFCNIGRKG